MAAEAPVLALLQGLQDRLTRAGLPRVGADSDSDDSISLNGYPVLDGDDGELLTGVQVRIRVPSRASDYGGGVGELLRRQQAVKDQFGSIEDEQVGEVTVAVSWRKFSTGVQKPDGRITLADTYYFRHDEG